MDLMTFLTRIILTGSQMGYPWESTSEDLKTTAGRTSDLKGADWTQSPAHPTPFPAPSPSPFPVFTPTVPNSQKTASLLTPAHLCYFCFHCPHSPPLPKYYTLATWCEELTHWKRPDAGKDWRQEEKGTTEDEMVEWHHQLNGHAFEQAPGIGQGEGRKTGVLQSVGFQRVRHNLSTEWQSLAIFSASLKPHLPCELFSEQLLLN